MGVSEIKGNEVVNESVFEGVGNRKLIRESCVIQAGKVRKQQHDGAGAKPIGESELGTPLRFFRRAFSRWWSRKITRHQVLLRNSPWIPFCRFSSKYTFIMAAQVASGGGGNASFRVWIYLQSWETFV